MSSETNVIAHLSPQTAGRNAVHALEGQNPSERTAAATGISRTFALIFVLSLVSSSCYFALAPDAGIGPGAESVNLARNLAADGTFANPYHALPTGPSAHMAPLYPLLMAALMRLSGSSLIFSLLIVAWNLIAQALMVACLPALSETILGRRKPGIVAACLFIILPLNVVWAQWEAMTVGCGLAFFCLGTRQLATTSLRGAALVGVAMGMLTLFSPTILIPCVVWCGYVLRSAAGPRILRTVLVAVMTLVFAWLPWTIRNYGIFDSLIPIRDNFGLELYISNRDGAGPTYMENFTLNPNMPHPNSNADEARVVRKLGEVEYNKNRQSLALEWIAGHPSEFFRLTALRIQRFWFPIPPPLPLSSYWVWTITALSLGGMAMLTIQRHPAIWFLLFAPALYALPYYLTNNDARYRYPVMWISALCVGYAVVEVFDRFRRRED